VGEHLAVDVVKGPTLIRDRAAERAQYVAPEAIPRMRAPRCLAVRLDDPYVVAREAAQHDLGLVDRLLQEGATSSAVT
jgi:hypothetical protein